jgi:glycerol-3-phosphate acyltransferase PlsX
MKAVIAALLDAFSPEEFKPHADALMPALLPLYATLSPDTYGGAILLGVDGVCIIAHGSSSAEAICNGIGVARDMIEHEITAEITAAIAATR